MLTLAVTYSEADSTMAWRWWA